MVRRIAVGVTLIEVLVATAIIGLLAALMMPAVQAARESARKTSCTNNLRQIGIAIQSHHAAHGRFPSNGWGYRWLGDPDRGYDGDQPGGWIYNVLPYLEQASLRERGRGSREIDKRLQMDKVVQVPVAVFHCPSRRKAATYPYLGRVALVNADRPSQAAKCDYAGNGGDTLIDHPKGGPPSLDPAAVASYAWPDSQNANGIFFVRSQVRAAMVTDGLSHTYLAGEKNVSTRPHDANRRDTGDDQTLYLGDDRDIRRWTDSLPLRDSNTPLPSCFGSAHPDGCHFVFGDASVKLIHYTIEMDVHRRLGNRSDGTPVNLSGL